MFFVSMLLLFFIQIHAADIQIIQDNDPQNVIKELVNYGDVYWEARLPKESQTNDHKIKMKSIEKMSTSLLKEIDNKVFDGFLNNILARNEWSKTLSKKGFFEIEKEQIFKLDQKAHKIYLEKTNSKTDIIDIDVDIIDILNLYKNDFSERDKEIFYSQQKFFLNKFEIGSEIEKENFWFFSQLYYVGIIKSLKQNFLSDQTTKKKIYNNAILQISTLIALFEEHIALIIKGNDSNIRNAENLVIEFMLATANQFPYQNLFSFYISQFVKNNAVQKYFKSQNIKTGNNIIDFLKQFKKINIGQFPDKWEKDFLPEEINGEIIIIEEIE